MNMKRTILTLSFVIVAMIATAQQIAVVTGNSTKLCQTLADAIEEASSGSTIYLPGGGFQISDDVKITKKVSIIGIGHKPVSENVDGNTVISGNLWFNEESDNSAIMGCYISGNVQIGYDNKPVNNILIQYCNLNSVQVYNNTCSGTTVSQNYIRSTSDFNGASAMFNNNIAHSISELCGGKIINNIIVSGIYYYRSTYGLLDCANCTIANNIFLAEYAGSGCSQSVVSQNMRLSARPWSDDPDPINIGATSWADVFANFNNGAISPASDFHFKSEYQQYEGQVGIYSGTEPFNPSALPPVPYIVSKVIPEQTDASGKLNIKIRVKAGEYQT